MEENEPIGFQVGYALGMLPEKEKEINKLKSRIKELEAWIKEDGEHTDTCTFHILKEVCATCRCDKSDKL